VIFHFRGALGEVDYKSDDTHTNLVKRQTHLKHGSIYQYIFLSSIKVLC